ncbi:hypothetical protein [Polaromonas sp. CG_9.11]|uniref:hypothetical protein n=1 Tax=Polaromonas sp. CG_9.11 TaxID=2787730 RepID=UPI0018CB50C6|nr:hypothetical protein [Polaromonas sp. CG_9.11]MBG6077395.1 hypothetical protein [Polaromonas sp. CG_9.11]
MKNIYKFISIALAFLIAGCATPARVDQMTASGGLSRTVPKDSPLRGSIGIKDVTGGRETNPMWVSNVSSADFERALEDSLRTAGLLNTVPSSGRFQLIADLVRLDQPILGFDMTVTAAVHYSVVERSTGKEIYTRVIPTPFTATVSDAFVGATRLKIATEGTIKKNIEALIDELIKLQIQVSMN